MKWFKNVIDAFAHRAQARSSSERASQQRESGCFDVTQSQDQRDFDSDYRAASGMLKHRLNLKYPDNYHARQRSGNQDRNRDTDLRMDAADKLSTVIAKRLREGASVKQAADDGARSVGI